MSENAREIILIEWKTDKWLQPAVGRRRGHELQPIAAHLQPALNSFVRILE